jgi:hypothetical protein
MAGESYEGHANRETWALCLHVANNQGIYYKAADYAKAFAATDTPPNSTLALGQDYLEALCDDLTEVAECASVQASRECVRMLLDIGSWWRIDAAEVGAMLRELVC